MMSLSSKLGWVALGVWGALVGCGKNSDNDANVAGGNASAGTAGRPGAAGAPSVVIEVPELGGTENAGSASAGAGGLPAQPTINCGQAGGENAGAGGADEECALPPSVCADSSRLAYYSSGACVGGTCRWTVETLECPGRCSRGSCAPPTTEK
jgi:hypothetical protein